MIITYFRSSSFNNWDLCQHQYFMCYVLGMPQDSNKKAEKGTIFHKTMELLAEATIAVRDWKPGDQHLFCDRQLGAIPVTADTLHTDAFLDRVFNAAYNHYTFPGRTRHVFSPADKREIYRWVVRTMESSYGLFDPRKRNIVATEPHFDLAIEEPWAHYTFDNPHGGAPITGQLHIKGTIDLITQVSPDMYELVDWKSGQRKDWGTGQEKDFGKLSIDPQLRMYHYALHRLYPDIKQVVVTINYVRPDQGGPFTMAYGPEDMTATLEMLRTQFERIKKCTRPSLKSPSGKHWFCTKVCSYGMNQHCKDPTRTQCQYIKQQIIRNGIGDVIKTETEPNHTVSNYENPGE